MSTINNEPANTRTGSKPPSVQKRKTVNAQNQEKKIGEDEFMAAAIGDVEWLKQSVRGNRGVLNYDKNGLTPLHLAAIHGRLECLKLLLEKFKVDISLPSKTGWRSVHLVISNQTGKRAFNSLCYLLEQGADPSIPNDDGITPMHQAASEGHVQCLKALIEAGAPADCLDYRGHTPIDLAKLWGHRKCARLLAAEKWHQDKRVLAHQMDQLQKIQMQKALRSIEEEEQDQAHKKFYGDIAFQDWLGRRGLDPKPTGPQPNEENYEVETKPRSSKQPGNTAKGEPLHRANTVHRPKAATPKPPTPIREESAASSTTPTRVSTSAKTPPKGKGVPSRESTMSDIVLLEDPPQAEATANTEVQTSSKLHMNDWNKSTKTLQSSYLPILGDHYPRDEFSMQPKHTPRRQLKTPSAQDEASNKSTVSPPMNEVGERPVVYKCKHIGDVHKRKHYDVEWLPRDEVGMHLSMDPTSQLFKSALVVSGSRTTTSTSSKRSSPESRPRSMDLPAMMQMMERMSNSHKYFPIHGSAGDAQTNLVA